jgi:hypothetical protein
MKYFTKEIWAAHQTTDYAETLRANEASDRSAREYRQQLEPLLPRLSKRDRFFFTGGEILHDGRLIEFIAGDEVGHDVHGPKKFNINAHHTSVLMKVLGCDLDVLYTLKYMKVKRVIFDYPTADPLFHKEGAHIGDWGYDELTDAGDGYLRHEVLFASGTTILIEFKHFSYKKEDCEGTRYL